MIDSKEKYRRKKMFREFVAEHEKQQKSERKVKWVLTVVTGLIIGFVSFSVLSATVSVASGIIGA